MQWQLMLAFQKHAKSIRIFFSSVSGTLKKGGRVSLVDLDLGQYLKELLVMEETSDWSYN